jgi:hypothetical protein
MQLLSSVLNNLPPQNPPSDLDWELLYRLSAKHSVSNMVFYGIDRLRDKQTLPEEVIMKFHNDCKKAIAKEATQHIALEQLLEAFEENKILSIPLKGSLMKYLYPRPDMRLMADVDLLIKEEQALQVKNLIQTFGYTMHHQDQNHDVYYRKPFMNVEIHHHLISVNSPYRDYLEKTWDRAYLKPDCHYTYQLTHEDFYIYLLIHLAKHYLSGGTGIRSVMDIWVYNKRYKAIMNWEYIKAELEKIDIWEFAQNIEGLSEAWFGDGQSSGKNSRLYEEMTAYIFSSGVYGNWKHYFLSSLRHQAEGEKPLKKYTYWLRLFFPSAKHLKNSYPFLDRLPFLLPVCWLMRGIKCVCYKRKSILYKINQVHQLSGNEASKLERFHRKTGIIK